MRILLLIGTLCIAVALGSAQTTLPLQGQLYQSDGMPVSDGDHTITVYLFDQATGGTSDRLVCDACTVAFRDGVFQLVLGMPGMPPLGELKRPLFVELTVDGEILGPRIQVHTVPFASVADNVPPPQPSLPVGTILAMAALPDGEREYMIADGRPLSSSQYPELFAAIGRTWGDASDSDTDENDFNLPDLRGVFLRGDDLGSGRDVQALNRAFPPGGSGDTSTVGSYQGIERFNVRQEFGQTRAVRKIGNALAVSGFPGAQATGATCSTYTPNAAVVYVIKVR